MVGASNGHRLVAILLLALAQGAHQAPLAAQPEVSAAQAVRMQASPARRKAPAGSSAAPAAASVSSEAVAAEQRARDQALRQRFETECLACHGPGGRSEQAQVPSLAGQHAFYAITQLFLYREGRRANPVMSAIAKGMSDAELRSFSELIASLPAVPAEPNASVDGARMMRGAQLAAQHRCGACHGNDYAGSGQVARIARQREDYLLMVLQEFKAGTRLGYTTAMNETLAGLGAEDLADVAYFLARAR